MNTQPIRHRASSGPHARIHHNYLPSPQDGHLPSPEDDARYVRACLMAGGFPWKTTGARR
jgi:hypothetical protein